MLSLLGVSGVGAPVVVVGRTAGNKKGNYTNSVNQSH
jgi:hypothetical protein